MSYLMIEWNHGYWNIKYKRPPKPQTKIKGKAVAILRFLFYVMAGLTVTFLARVLGF